MNKTSAKIEKKIMLVSNIFCVKKINNRQKNIKPKLAFIKILKIGRFSNSDFLNISLGGTLKSLLKIGQEKTNKQKNTMAPETK